MASSPRHFVAPPLRSPLIWAMSWVGTISWFFEPISTAVSTLKTSAERYRTSVGSSFIVLAFFFEVLQHNNLKLLDLGKFPIMMPVLSAR